MSTEITEYVRTATDDPDLSVTYDGEQGYVAQDGTLTVPDDLSRYTDRELTVRERFAVQAASAMHLAVIRAETPLDAKETIVNEFDARFDVEYEPTLVSTDAEGEVDDADESAAETADVIPPHVAGHTLNTIEDARARFVGQQTHPEFRKTVVAVIALLMDSRTPVSEGEGAMAMQEGLVHLTAAGYANGYADADADVREFLAWARPRLDAARREGDPEARLDAAREVAEGLLSVAGVEGANASVEADPDEVARLDALDADPDLGAWYGFEGDVPEAIPVPSPLADA